jgi:hypothetical protein
MPCSRSCVPLAALVLVVLSPRPLWAFGVTDIVLRKADNSSLDIYNSVPYLNQAQCRCNANIQVQINLDWSTSPSSSQHLAVLVGQGSGHSTCLDVPSQGLKLDSTCPVLFADHFATQVPRGTWILTATSQQLEGSTCTGQQAASGYIFVYIMDTATDSKWVEAKKFAYTIATQPPDLPTVGGQGDLVAGESAVQVTITIPGGVVSGDAGSSTLPVNLKGYQVLCEKVDSAGNPAGYALSSPPDAAFKTPDVVCPSTTVADLGVADKTVVDSQPIDAGAVDRRTTDATLDAGVADRGTVDSKSSTPTSGCGAAASAACVCSDYASSSTSVEVKGLQNGQTYRFYMVAIDNYYNPSTPVKIGDATPALVEDLWKRYQRAGGRATGGYCFVATAAYGSYDHPQVRILRDFRDQVLMSSSLGRDVVGAYYRSGAAPAAWLEQHPSMRPVARALLWPITLGAAAVVYTSSGGKLLVLTALPLAVLLIRRRRAGDRGGRR